MQKKIKDYREERGVTAKFLAKYLNISHTTLSLKENGKRKWSALEVQLICKLWDISIEEIDLQ